MKTTAELFQEAMHEAGFEIFLEKAQQILEKGGTVAASQDVFDGLLPLADEHTSSSLRIGAFQVQLCPYMAVGTMVAVANFDPIRHF